MTTDDPHLQRKVVTLMGDDQRIIREALRLLLGSDRLKTTDSITEVASLWRRFGGTSDGTD